MLFLCTTKESTLSLLFNRRTQLKALTAAVLALSTCQSYAAAFSIFGEASGHNAGDYGAGVGAEAYDASTLFYNPAGLVLLDNSQLVLGASLVNVNSEFSGSQTVQQFGPAFTFTASGTVENKDKYIPVPNAYYARKVNDRLAWGIGVFAPFGLKTDWGEDSILRYAATSTKLMIIDVSPAVSAKITDKVSVGIAFDAQYATVDYNVIGGVPVGGDRTFDSISLNHGTSIGVGAHGGIMWQVKPHTRLGVNYQSKVQHQFYGTSSLDGILVGNAPINFAENPNLFSEPANFPAMTTVGVYHEVNSQWAVMGSASYVEWSSIQNLVLHGTEAAGGRIDVTADLNFKNTWRVVGGAKYKLTDKWTMRGGIGYDQTPTNDTDRDIRLPDGDRVGVALGGHYQYNDKVGVDFGWTHLFMHKASLNKVQNTARVGGGVAQTATTTGTVTGNANIIGAQVKWKIT